MIIGHDAIRARFQALLQDGKFPQTSLFYGLNGSGKKKVALEVAQALLVHDDNTRALFEAGNHPDFYLIAPQQPKSASSAKKNSSPGSIRSEQVQDLKKALGFPPLLGDSQVVILDNAHHMTMVTANSLLKILEEPKPHQVFILITPSLHDILVTIRSRTARFFFPPLKAEDVRQIVLDLRREDPAPDPQKLDFLTRCFPGSPALIHEALNFEFSVSEIASWCAAPTSLNDVRKKILPKLDDDFDMSLFLQILRQVRWEAVLSSSEPKSEDLGFFNKIQDAQRQLDRHIPAEFVLENLFL